VSPSSSESNLINRVGEDKDGACYEWLMVYVDFCIFRCIFCGMVCMVFAINFRIIFVRFVSCCAVRYT
jgi:hypothetical protein